MNMNKLGVLGGAVIGAVILNAAPGLLRPTDLRCEYLQDPCGIDVEKPRLSWVSVPSKRRVRAQEQTAYQVQVASSAKSLATGQADLWDSGKALSDQSIHVRYQGRALNSSQECYWRVRVWDSEGAISAWSQPARWSMGLLRPEDWKAKWIGRDETEPGSALAGTKWVWFPEGNPATAAPVGTRYFRRMLNISQDAPLKRAQVLMTADNEFTLFVNGKPAGSGNNFRAVTDADITALLQKGHNVLAVAAKNAGTNDNPAGLVGLVRLEYSNGQRPSIPTDREWKAANQEIAGWEQVSFDDSSWRSAQESGEVGMQPWGQVSGPEERRLPARWLRREFKLSHTPVRATAYGCGLGCFELYLNGRKVDDHVLSPALTEYPKRVAYVSFDVKSHVRLGANAVGVILGNGRYYAPRLRVPIETRTYGYPKLCLQLRFENADGTVTEVLSDESWKLTTNGPIRANNEYDGEEYDARLEMPGWNQPGYDDSKWDKADVVSAPGGVMAAQMMNPIRVTQTLKPVAMTNPKPGVYIFDLGQNLVGWCRMRVSGPRGTAVSLRHAETLRDDRTLYLDNLRSAKVTDTYILRGLGSETYEPRFVYHGFRYVEVTGLPQKPDLSLLEGRVVHDDLESAGEFACSNPLLNRIYQNVRWGVRGNYRSLPTDCPQRDERQGWLGDRAEESKGETYLFHTAALHAKWLQDMADAQKANGSVPDVCPSYWPIYSDNITWPSSTVVIPSHLLGQYADVEVIRRHYPSMARWINYMAGFLTDDLMPRDTYGDWCVPPEDPKLIHSQDPLRKTAPTVLGTTHFFRCLQLAARYAELLDQREDAQRYRALAAKLQEAFHKKYFRPEQGWYDNGSQTSCILPLAFDMVPADQCDRVFNRLTDKIANESKNHVGTGLVGGQWLMRTLTRFGRADLAYTLASQRTYPSWGYMIDKGATTVWELWNGDTADPAMNSGNHVMLVGDLIVWLHEHLAGIKPDPRKPGFKHILMRPEPVGDLQFVKAVHRSPYGLISSHWRKQAEAFHWQITIPPNASATVYVRAKDRDSVTESGQPARAAEGVTFLWTEPGYAVFQVRSGQYSFQSR